MSARSKRLRDLRLRMPCCRLQPTTAKVRCNGQLHRIHFDGQHLIPLDHPNLAREKKLYEFGRQCKCLDILRLWNGRDKGLPANGRLAMLPPDLRDPYVFWREARCCARFLAKLMDTEAPSPCKERRMIGTVEKVLAWLGYDAGRFQTSGTASVRVSVGKKPSMGGYWCRCTKAVPACRRQPQQAPHDLRVCVREDWFEKVYRKGLAVIDGRFVLDFITVEDMADQLFCFDRLREVIRVERAVWRATTNGASLERGHINLQRALERAPRRLSAWWFVRGLTAEKGPYYLIDDPRRCFVCPVIARRVEQRGADGRLRTCWKELENATWAMRPGRR